MHSDPHAQEPVVGRDIVLVHMDDYFLPLRALTKACGLSVKTLRAHLADPVHPLPHYRPGGKILVRWRDFVAWLEHYKANAAADLDRMVREVMTDLQGPKSGGTQVRDTRRSRREVKGSSH